MSDSTILARAEECDDVLMDWWSFKHGISAGTQVTCDADEVALIVAEGRLVEQLGAGRHELTQEGHPKLARFIGQSASPVNVAFVWTSNFTLPFSGPVGTLVDARTKQPFDAFVSGSCRIEVGTPARLLELEGPSQEGSAEKWIEQVLMKAAREEIGKLEVTAQAVEEGMSLPIVVVAQVGVAAAGVLLKHGVSVLVDDELVLTDQLEEESEDEGDSEDDEEEGEEEEEGDDEKGDGEEEEDE